MLARELFHLPEAFALRHHFTFNLLIVLVKPALLAPQPHLSIFHFPHSFCFKLRAQVWYRVYWVGRQSKQSLVHLFWLAAPFHVLSLFIAWLFRGLYLVVCIKLFIRDALAGYNGYCTSFSQVVWPISNGYDWPATTSYSQILKNGYNGYKGYNGGWPSAR